MKDKKTTHRPKQKTEWVGALFGRLIVFAGGFLLYALFSHQGGSTGALVCDDTSVDVALTRFGTCRKE